MILGWVVVRTRDDGSTEIASGEHLAGAESDAATMAQYLTGSTGLPHQAVPVGWGPAANRSGASTYNGRRVEAWIVKAYSAASVMVDSPTLTRCTEARMRLRAAADVILGLTRVMADARGRHGHDAGLLHVEEIETVLTPLR